MGRRDARPLWTITRVDVLGHQSTQWFSALEHHLRLQCQCANQAGVLERSLASMARIASGDGQTLTVTPADIEASIARLSAAGHVVWFREWEVLWWVEMADEQKPSDPSKQPDFWARIRDQVVGKLINQIRRLICKRYPDLISENANDVEGSEEDSGPDLHQISIFGSLDREREEERDRDQERRSGRRKATPARSGRRKKSSEAGVDPAMVDAVIDAINVARARVIPGAVGYKTDSKSQRGWVAKATKREGATLDDWRSRIEHLAEAADRDAFWVQHLTLQYLHWAKNWEKWADASAVPPRRGARAVKHIPSNFDRGDQSFGINDGGADVA